MSLTARPYLQKHAGGQRYKWVIKLAVHVKTKDNKTDYGDCPKTFVHANFSFISNLICSDGARRQRSAQLNTYQVRQM